MIMATVLLMHDHPVSLAADKLLAAQMSECAMLQIAGMKLETDNAPPPQRHSAPTVATGNPEGPVPKHVTAALRQSAPAAKVSSHVPTHAWHVAYLHTCCCKFHC